MLTALREGFESDLQGSRNYSDLTITKVVELQAFFKIFFFLKRCESFKWCKHGTTLESLIEERLKLEVKIKWKE